MEEMSVRVGEERGEMGGGVTTMSSEEDAKE